eukprot:TRINITY_DN44387_c0_g1_i2.p1 TRINITY_DN44387_c0_g1~~TRINITY_DN44387_c0_g1_i2.p1  ORF type:complete len:228 (-),score=30.23 TRINITY_DN44387_c0_g1_i2:136-819(-)
MCIRDRCVVRPSLLDGAGGYGAWWLRAVARSPIQVIPTGATGQIAALTAGDLGDAYAVLAAAPDLDRSDKDGKESWRDVELGGVTEYSYSEYLDLLREDYRISSSAIAEVTIPNHPEDNAKRECWLFTKEVIAGGTGGWLDAWLTAQAHKQPWRVWVPDAATRLGAHVCDLFHATPFSYGHWILLQRNNVPSPNRLPELLGRQPTPICREASVAPTVEIAKQRQRAL